MCGIFGVISSDNYIDQKIVYKLAKHARQRGRDSSGLITYEEDYNVLRADFDILKLVKKKNKINMSLAIGHSRLITNGLTDNQPVIRDDVLLIHNGIIVNEDEIWKSINIKRKFEIDSEVIIGIILNDLNLNKTLDEISNSILAKCKGAVSAVAMLPKLGKAILLSNNGSLYLGKYQNELLFSSEEYILKELNCNNIERIVSDYRVIDIPRSLSEIEIVNHNKKRLNLIPELSFNKEKESFLEYSELSNIKRCTKCILPETMPYITFDEIGECNYCKSYKIKNKPKNKDELLTLVEEYRRPGNKPDCIVPFSGGRDSCYGLHLIVEELGMKPITYTYDWGMVTDLGRRNISRMCSQLNVENIIVAADLEKKRKNVAKNLKAWLKNPNLGMMGILTAGDKHFFKYVETVKKQTGINLNLWGINPLEVTHFKTGFLNIPPDFENNHVYTNGALKQMQYQSKRFKAMLESPGYFNSSLFDTLSGEYYRSFTKKSDYFHIFDYWKWDEHQVDDTLLNLYDWEKAIDTPTTWRIGDATAAFYNYVYYTVAGFTEHDTFRSNQIREGDITRDQALILVAEENRPRYPNIKWYLDVLGIDFYEAIKIVNNIPKIYHNR